MLDDVATHYFNLAAVFRREMLDYGTAWRDVEAWRQKLVDHEVCVHVVRGTRSRAEQRVPRRVGHMLNDSGSVCHVCVGHMVHGSAAWQAGRQSSPRVVGWARQPYGAGTPYQQPVAAV